MRLSWLVLLLLVPGCWHTPESAKPQPPQIDDRGCVVPSPDTFSQLGFTLDIAKSSWDKFLFGGIKIEENPQLQTLISQSAHDAELLGYLDCRAIHDPQNTQETRDYLQTQLLPFMQTHPSAKELADWQKNHPSPQEQKERIRKEEADKASKEQEHISQEESAWKNAKFVGNTTDHCRNGKMMVVNDIQIPENTTKEIRLASAVKELRWECGESKDERVANDEPFDKIVVSRFGGAINWAFYKK